MAMGDYEPKNENKNKMKNLILLSLALLLTNCAAQKNTNTMEYLNLDQYKDWGYDTRYKSSSTTFENFIKGKEQV